MVNAGALEEYELWFALASFFAAAVVGFLVAFIQSFGQKEVSNGRTMTLPADKTFLVVAVLFGVLAVAAGLRTSFLRRRIKKKSTSYKMRVTSN